MSSFWAAAPSEPSKVHYMLRTMTISTHTTESRLLVAIINSLPDYTTIVI